MSWKYYEEFGESDLQSAAVRMVSRVDWYPEGESMTRQEFAEECDINVLMSRYEKTGMLPVNERAPPMYVDFSAVPDFQTGMQLMIDAEEAFMRLPAKVRKEFDNDPLRFVEYAQDGDNLEKLREWGLAEPEKAPDAPMRVEVVNPAPTADPKPAGSS